MILLRLKGVLYHRQPDGALARCLGRAEATETLNKVHKDVCGQTLDVTLYRRLQRLGYYWPEMSKEAQAMEEKCRTCQANPH